MSIISSLTHQRSIYFSLPLYYNENHILLLHQIAESCDGKSSIFNPSFHKIMIMSSFKLDVVNKAEEFLNKNNKDHLSLIEGFLRHTFKNSKSRLFYCPKNVKEIVDLMISSKRFEYMKFFLFTSDKIEFVNLNKEILYKPIKRLSLKIMKIALFKIKTNFLDEIIGKYYNRMNDIKIVQRTIRKWLIKRQLYKEIGPNLSKLLKRRELNMRKPKGDDNICTVGEYRIKLTPFNTVPSNRISDDLKKIDKEKLMKNWKLFWDRKPLDLDNSIESKIYRTILNHAKWNPGIFKIDLYWTLSGSSFLLLEFDKEEGLMKEIHGFYLRSFYRRLISNQYEPYVGGLDCSVRPIIAKGGLFNNIIRGIHSKKLTLLDKMPMDEMTGEDLQGLFWVKYGSKSRTGNTVLKHVMWTRNGENYVFHFKTQDRGYHPHKSRKVGNTFKIRNIDSDMNDWIKDLYEKSAFDIDLCIE
jgi:hypothetical protein